ncbi:MAG: hypothetical protein J6X17_04675 [Lachnospiraceae bacterium]|nr:hypothetical protein [Lachnospiraceae bacterium]
MDPNGSHGQGDIFLRKFIEIVLKAEMYIFSDIEYQQARVVCEECKGK